MIIPSFMHLSLSTSTWRLISESSWEEQHVNFANGYNCFSHSGSKIAHWCRTPQMDPQNGPFRWILEDLSTGEILGGFSLILESHHFVDTWIETSGTKAQNNRIIDEALAWLIEAIAAKVKPDRINILEPSTFFDCLAADQSEHRTIQIMGFQEDMPTLQSVKIIVFTIDSWAQCQAGESARAGLAWLRRRSNREAALEDTAKKPRPFLLRLLASLSPIRSRRRSSPMIHPLKTYARRNSHTNR